MSEETGPGGACRLLGQTLSVAEIAPGVQRGATSPPLRAMNPRQTRPEACFNPELPAAAYNGGDGSFGPWLSS